MSSSPLLAVDLIGLARLAEPKKAMRDAVCHFMVLVMTAITRWSFFQKDLLAG